MIQRIAKALNLSVSAITKVIELFDSGATIPFVARYRKEATGGLDEVQLMSIKDEWEMQQAIDKRKESILKSIETQGKLTDELKARIEATFDLNLLEDLYLPYKQKQTTRASKAREKGLAPLAELIWAQASCDIDQAAEKFLNDQVFSREEAILGACDIIAEQINESEDVRAITRQFFARTAQATISPIKDKPLEGSKYSDYIDFAKPLSSTQPHQFLAILRAEQEGFLRLSVEPDQERMLERLRQEVINPKCPKNIAVLLEDTVEDSYKRLLKPAISKEFINAAKEKADDYSIQIFAENLRALLLASPLGNKRVLAIDPGFASGCKVVCLSDTGNLVENTIIYPTPPRSRVAEAERIIRQLVEKYNIEAIAVGNGTAGRETEQFIRGIKFDSRPPQLFLVNENGASIYSASEIARQEFPDEDLTVRGAVSIGRRLVDPLAELVKIDPKSIGVGQYQHDVDQRKLQNKLGAVVESCVNSVGIDLNTASEHLLTYVSGLGPALARNIVSYRQLNGAFTQRQELLKIPRLGAKAYEQAAGFLRIRAGKNPLDNTAVHPEAYAIVEKMAKDLDTKIEDLLATPEKCQKLDLSRYCSDKIGLPTLKDIIAELAKPGRDPRSQRQSFQFADVQSIDDLKEGMTLPCIVTNLTAFGAFVDLGIKQNGLIHKSKMSNRRVNMPSDVLKLGQELQATIIGIDKARDRIQMSLID
jgi:protein Tex